MSHIPVLVDEVMEHLAPQPGNVLVDATIGHGGHAKAYLAAAADTRVIGIDADEQALAQAKHALASYGDRVQLEVGMFAQLGQLVATEVDHVLFDLGVGSHQLADETRGFSFRFAGPLTMRYGRGEDLPASDHQAVQWLERKIGHAPDADELIAGLKEAELADIIWRYGEERMSRRIAKAIKQAGKLTTAAELADVIQQAVPATYERGRIHPSTRTFQALRMVVNRELESLALALPQAVQMLKGGGKLAVISFHSLEDRTVKQFMREESQLEVITKKPVQAGEEEKQQNPRSRSAKLRVARKIINQTQTHDSKHFTTRRTSTPRPNAELFASWPAGLALAAPTARPAMASGFAARQH